MIKRDSAVKPFIHFEPLGSWDKIAVFAYLTFSILFLLINFYSSFAAKGEILIVYVVLLQLLSYLLNYKSLRNFRCYLVWLSFAVFHLLLFFLLKNNPSYSAPKARITGILPNTIILLLLFQGLRFLSLKIQHRELIAPVKGGGKSLLENKEVSLTDFSLFIIYMTCWFGLCFLGFIYI